MKYWVRTIAGLVRSGIAAGLMILSAQGNARPLQDAGGPPAQSPDDAREVPLFGKVASIGANGIEVTKPDGDKVTVKFTNKTEFRKDRQPAKKGDFKIGDMVLIRGEENPDHSWTAQVVGGRSGNGPGGREQTGTLGKDYVVGEIKSIDAPAISVLRTDKVTQKLELNEDTSLRRGRESITMADVQVGDHVFARGGLQGDVFVPKTVVVIAPEQWKRMQEMGYLRPQSGSGDKSTPPQGKPAGPQN